MKKSVSFKLDEEIIKMYKEIGKNKKWSSTTVLVEAIKEFYKKYSK
jgi:predicted transcriptional regulator